MGMFIWHSRHYLRSTNVQSDIISKIKLYTIELWKEQNLIDIAAPSYLTLNVAIKNKDSFKKIIALLFGTITLMLSHL